MKSDKTSESATSMLWKHDASFRQRNLVHSRYDRWEYANAHPTIHSAEQIWYNFCTKYDPRRLNECIHAIYMRRGTPRGQGRTTASLFLLVSYASSLPRDSGTIYAVMHEYERHLERVHGQRIQSMLNYLKVPYRLPSARYGRTVIQLPTCDIALSAKDPQRGISDYDSAIFYLE